ncbi:hypothetical protein [Niveibacterium microcysteis]|uniref:Uncharacterized protein n=1 Tax=Niveibacterium microcysteis TaxID=2811415 RepID=A0ABX7M8I9_9RHOO|nr:hypothetical protein [Niveibacterium microcysteis]QSI78051.1 hypothetical protein JY500_05245 [Niveibacterium microcysteis]
MRGLKGLLIRKIVITAIFWCVPLLLFPSQWFIALGMPAPEPLLIARLLGAAYLALLVGYGAGLQALRRGESPLAVIDMGITSNGAAALLMLYFGTTGSWAQWGIGAQVFMWLSALGAGSIAASLLRFRLRHRAEPKPSRPD